MEKVMEFKEIEKELLKPFDVDEIKWRVGSTFIKDGQTKGIAVPYLTRVAIQNRLDKVFGLTGWKNEYQKWGEDSQLCGISFKVGDSEWITKWDGAGNTEIEGVKGGLSDSFKRAATMLGIGRYLYKMAPAFVDVDVKGSKKNISHTDMNNKLPAFYIKEVARIFGTSEVSNSKKQTKVSNASTNTSSVPENVLNALNQLIQEKRVDIKTILKTYKVNTLSELNMEQISNAMSRLSKTKVA